VGEFGFTIEVGREGIKEQDGLGTSMENGGKRIRNYIIKFHW